MRTFTRIFTLLCAAVLLLTGCTAAQPEIIRTEADPVENAEWKILPLSVEKVSKEIIQ